MTANCEGPVTIFIIDTQVSDTEHISLLPYLQTKMAKGPIRIFCFKFIKCYLFCPVLRRLRVPRCPADRERLDPKKVIVKHWTWWLFTLVRKWIPWGWIPECKVLMSQMSQWFMSHESMSQWVRSEKITVSVETIKLSITFTYFVYFLHCCLHKAYFWPEISTYGCLLAVPGPCRIAEAKNKPA